MLLPLPRSTQRQRWPAATGSSDALLLANAAQSLRAQGHLLAVLCANATDAQRLRDEVPFFAPDLRIHLLPDWETLPYDQFSPHQDLVSERLETLHHVSQRQVDVLVVPVTTALYCLAPPAHLAAYTFFFRQGERLDERALRSQLTLAGYQHVSQVMAPGDYSVRGGLIDLFPMGSVVPYRLDLMGDEIETIRTFDVDTQRSLYPVKEVRLLPGREFPLDESARTAFGGRWRERFEGDPSKSVVYRDIGNGIPSAGIEYYLPLFFEQSATLFDYLHGADVLAMVGDAPAAIGQFWSDTQQRFRFLSADRERPLLAPDQLFLTDEAFFTRAKDYARITFDGERPADFPIHPLPDVSVDRRAEVPLARFSHYLGASPARILVTAESAGRRETMLQYFAEYGLKPELSDSLAAFLDSASRFGLCVAPLSAGFVADDIELSIITESELYAGSAVRRGARRQQERLSNVEMMVRDLSELRIGDPVVHAQHGIGRYLGLENMDLGEGVTEFLHLEYADHTKLYVPVSQLHVISRYSGATPEQAPLHALGSGQWEKAKRRAARQIRDTAAELLNIYARRAARPGHAFTYSQHDYEAFAESFGFEETADQAAAIEAVRADMMAGRPMDRLVCGDVGFGKTEVALRAAFVAVMGGRQVALLAPTTLLTEQHFRTFSDRFADWPVRVAELSRFRSAKEVSAAVAGINDGTIDIVIGTHKLLSSDVRFARLGLVIIDEEHRFGVRQKERMKELRAEVDVLTLTATPIPRTLGLSLEGIRDFSVIATAPQKRLAIKTFVRRESDGTVREAVLRELKRGGQVFYLHNEVETIDNRRAALATLIPEARIAIAHGQMGERELEQVMREFYQQRHNLLLCTTIIETGIDIPTANTIIIRRADRFGLAQLHQLRGRVGRSHHQAYAYLMVPDESSLTRQAQLRLDAIQQMEELGSGFYLALHDLEIRGAGEVLGENQSGNMHEIGFQLYSEMLNDAVRALRQGQEPDLNAPLAATTEINLHVPALLPEDYCGDVHERLSIYKRLASCETLEQLTDIQEEIIDRFGRPPDPVHALIETHRLRLVARPLGISKIDAHAESVTFQFIPNPPIESHKIIALVQSSRHLKLFGQDKLRLTLGAPELAARLAAIRSTLSALGR
jgi:transcription-repair coupling factor (superfamily II helicase)